MLCMPVWWRSTVEVHGSHIGEAWLAFESVLIKWMKLEPIIQSEVSQGEKKTPIQYINAYIWNLDREGDGTPLHYSCLANPMGRGAW